MKRSRRLGRPGSALLIVIGLLSFMFVSAIGFAVYMRTSRVPSSYLRRNVAARHLVKAALAKAIGELEGDFNIDPNWGTVVNQGSSNGRNPPVGFYGIYDDPFPGIVMNKDEREKTDDDSGGQSIHGDKNGDFWLGRVFMPFGSTAWDSTVSTLTLEALAYLPPALIDDVRCLSRYTRTACWRQLPYGIGRYAYCAVNVSDLFDINKLRASEPRDSGMNRITLTALCMKTDGSIDTAAAGELDAVLDKADPVSFVSLADFNLVAANNNGNIWAPFMDAIGGQAGNMLKDNVWQHENALFITDTWFPPTNTVNEQTASYDPAHPFSSYDASSFLDVINYLNPVNGGSSADFYMNNLGIGIACLYDYLDSDSKPISLALPTTEAVPMIVGVSAPAGLKLEVGQIGDSVESTVNGIAGTVYKMIMDDSGSMVRQQKDSSEISCTRILQCIGVTSFGAQVNVPVVVTSPFKRLAKTSRAKTYTVQGFMRVWLAPAEMGCRLADGEGNLYPEVNWAEGTQNGVATFKSSSMSLSEFAGDIKTTSDAITEKTLEFSNLNVQMPIYYNVIEKDPKPSAADQNDGYEVELSSIQDKTFKGSYKSFGDLHGKKNMLVPLKLNGLLNDEKAKNAKFEKEKPYAPGDGGGVTEFDPASIDTEFHLYAALWIQVLDGNQVVDMVPACAKDDKKWLGAGDEVVAMLGDATPLLNFESSDPIKYANIENSLPNADYTTFTEWASLYAVDPRYNYAPEDWFASATPAASKSVWMNKLGLSSTSSSGSSSDFGFGKAGRDRDIFMFVSDNEYLQSIGELQFLPWIENIFYDLGKFGNYNPSFGGQPFSNRKEPNDASAVSKATLDNMVNGNRFWKTYSAFPIGGDDLDVRNPYEMRTSTGSTAGARFVSDMFPTSGFKLNPFSQDDRVLRAAFAGTPFDWYVASTNSNQTQSGGRKNNLVGDNMTLDKMINQYSFGGNNDVAKMSNDDLNNICDAFISVFRDEAAKSTVAEPADWYAAYDSLNWSDVGINDDNTAFLGATLNDSDILHGVDRKYLYSFWRECFDNRQQLFLIFVRAEPASVGGGGAGKIPSQMGGRAVALVWRDPEPPATASGTTRPTRKEFNDNNTSDNILYFLEARGGTKSPPHRTRVLFYHQFD